MRINVLVQVHTTVVTAKAMVIKDLITRDTEVTKKDTEVTRRNTATATQKVTRKGKW